jgi:hypothetical protein
MNKKYLVLPAVLVVAAAAVTAINMWPTELRELREKNLCLGMLTEETAGLIEDGKGGAVRVEEFPDSSGSATKPADPVFSTTCYVHRENPGGETKRLQYSLGVDYGSTLRDSPEGSTYIGEGLTGWVGQRQSEVQLPDGCAKKMRRPDARYITVSLTVSPVAIVGRDWNYASLMKDSRTIILEAVDNLTRQYDCA